MANSTNSGEVEDSSSKVDDTSEAKDEKCNESDEGKVGATTASSEETGDKVEFKVIFNKKKYDLRKLEYSLNGIVSMCKRTKALLLNKYNLSNATKRRVAEPRLLDQVHRDEVAKKDPSRRERAP